MKYFVLLVYFSFIFTVINIVQSITTSINNLEKNCNSKISNEPVIALILARGGSKGVYRKNLRQLNKISLLGRNIVELKRSELFHEIWVSTEDNEIAFESKKYGAFVHERSKYLAQDNTSSLDSVKEFLQSKKHINKFALFQCTSIFLKTSYIEEAFKLFQQTECVFSVTRIFKLRWRLNDDNNYAIPLNFDPKNRPRRQDWPGELIETGMFYFTNRQLIEKENAFQSDKCRVVEILSEDSLEIDSEMDLKIAEMILKIRDNF